MKNNENFLSIMDLLPKSPDELFDIAEDLRKRGDNEFAFQILQYLIEREKDSAKFLNQYGIVSLALGKRDIAKEAFEHTLTLEPDRAYTSAPSWLY